MNKLFAKLLIISALTLLFSGVSNAADDSKSSYYLSQNKERYDSFIAETKLPDDTAVAYVNAGADKDFYSDIMTVGNPEDTLVLCSKNYALPQSFVPFGLTSIGNGHKLRYDAAESFLRMQSDAAEDGLGLIVYSAYRSYENQVSVYNRYLKNSNQASVDRYSARPGHSEHQTGLAVDILHKYGSSGFRSAAFQKTGEYDWLMENAYKYGFILRYPDGYRDITGYTYEPWHWRYVGVDAATVMKDTDIATFEEYFGKFIAPKEKFEDFDDGALPYYFAVITKGKPAVVESFYINGEHCFKLRDIAYFLKGSEHEFDVTWDKKSAFVEIIPEIPYREFNDYELTRSGKSEQPVSGADIMCGGKKLDLSVYNIAGNSYVSLSEFCCAIGVELNWNGIDDVLSFSI